MKVSFGKQQLRLRLVYNELLRLLDGETVSVEVSAPGLGWAVSLVAGEDGAPFEYEAHAGRLTCRLPRAELRLFAAKLPGRESLQYELACDAVVPVSISIDVDIRTAPSRRTGV